MKRIFSMIMATALMCAMLTVGASAAGTSKAYKVAAGTDPMTDQPTDAYEITFSNVLSGPTKQVFKYRDWEADVHDGGVFKPGYKESEIAVITLDPTCTISSSYHKSMSMYPQSLDDNLHLDGLGYAFVNNNMTAAAMDKYIRDEFGLTASQPLWLPIEGGAVEGVGERLYFTVGATADNATKPASVTAAPTASKVLVNGKETAFDAYTINGNNYFKIRDIASVLNGTGKQFDVIWDKNLNAVSMTSNHSYTAVGGEMAKGDSASKTATVNTAKVYMDGKEISLTAYTINGNNYVKLRDLGQLINFGVRWENAVVIDTNTGYTAE